MVCTVGAALAVTEQSAAAVGANQSTLTSVVPSAITPNVNNGIVYAIGQVGSWIVVGGSFTSVTPHGSSTAVVRNHVFAFDAATGALSNTFAPSLDGQVNSVIAGPTAGTVYLGGQFSNVGAVRSKGVALLNITNGSVVAGFKPASMNGRVDDLRLSAGRLYMVGGFTTVGGAAHGGVATLNATTGAVDPFMSIQLTGHHNYNGTGATGTVGGRALDISPDGSRAVVVGDFKNANGALHDQVVMIDLGGSSATIDPNWNTSAFSARCSWKSFDSYVRDVDFSPDGSYFAIVATGAGTTSLNVDGTRSLCDSASRWGTTATGSNVKPTWIDYTGNDTFWSVAVTGTAVYAGGHQRWVNNPSGVDYAAAGAVPRPGIVALDPVNGMPFAWNPGRNPRGAGAYALLATSQGLYVGSDTDWIGNFTYKRQKLAYFPLAGGTAPVATATAQLPANLYLAGPTNSGSTDALLYHAVNGTSIGSAVTVPNSVAWSTSRGAFMAGNTIFFGSTNGNFYGAPFSGSTVGTPVVLDPYDDPYWSNVQTGSGQTYRGVKPTFYGELASVTGAFYANGRMYYSLSGKTALYWRYFEPDSGTIGGQEFSVTGANFGNVAGMVLSGTTLYYANRADGTLHAMPFVNGVPSSSGDTVVSGPSVDGIDWRARSLFLYAS